MKKKLLFIFLTIFILLFSLTSCDKKDNDNKDDKKEDIITTLTAPTISSNKNIILWNAVTNAKGYVVNVNDKDQAEQTTTSFEVKGDAGSYNIKVKAIGDGTNYKNSEYSNTLTIIIEEEKLDAPIISATDTLIKWEKVDNADSYIINVDGIDKETITKTEYDFISSVCGSFKIKIKAISSEKNLESLYSNEITIGIYDEYLPDFSLIDDDSLKTISWSKVKKADLYRIYIDDVEKTTTTDLSYDYSSIEKVGKHTIKVVAESNNISYGPSEAEIEITIALEKLATPVTKLLLRTIEWEKIDNAIGYIIYDNDVEIEKTVNNYFDVNDITVSHKYKIKAVSNSEKYSDSDFSKEIVTKISLNGYLDDTTGNYDKYLNTNAYVQVTNAYEFLTALKNAKYDYTSTATAVLENKGYVVRNNVRKGGETRWADAIKKGLYIKNEDDSFTKILEGTLLTDPNYTDDMIYYEDSPYSPVSFTQTLNKAGTVHVIEIMNDINLGWNVLSTEAKNVGNVVSFGNSSNEQAYTMSSMYKQNGISQITISNCYDLLIYSKNGAKLTHAGFKLESSNKVSIRNLEFDEMWQWEDSSSKTTAAVGDMDAFGWAYFKINYCDEIWIDHCTFGKAYDGLIDIANPTYDTLGTLFRAPYLADGSCDNHISWCKFTSGLDDKDGYLYKMMEEIEADYQANGGNYLYYKALRDAGYTFDEILYGIAIPQKKAFLDGDGTDSNYYNNKDYNENLNLSIFYCEFIDVEDRIPKVRSGNVYMYGTIIDSSRYYEYRKLLKSKDVSGTKINAKDVVASVNSSWKCAGVSHALMASQDGSIYALSCEFKGVETLICNNDYGKGGILLENCSYYIDNNNFISADYIEKSPFTGQYEEFYTSHTSGLIFPEYFFWNNETNSIPFYTERFPINFLDGTLNPNNNYQIRVGTIMPRMYEIYENYLLVNKKINNNIETV